MYRFYLAFLSISLLSKLVTLKLLPNEVLTLDGDDWHMESSNKCMRLIFC